MRKFPQICLEIDKDWDKSRPIPLEPTRWGKIVVHNNELITKHPIIEKYLSRNNYHGSYYNVEVVNKILEENNIKLNPEDIQLLELASKLESQDKPASYILNSLLFKVLDYEKVESHIHQRLTASTLVSNQEMPKIIFNSLNQSSALSVKPTSKNNKKLTILDPFSGGGALSFILAEWLSAITNDFEIINSDISSIATDRGKNIILQTKPELLKKFESNITYLKQDALTLDQIADKSIDVIITMRALHELNSKQVLRFFHASQKKLVKNGVFVCVDVTREPTILARAEKLLPLLGQFSLFTSVLQQYQQLNTNDENFVEQIIQGDPILTQAGINSYRSGFLAHEITHLAKQTNASNIRSSYVYSPPIGCLRLSFHKN